MNIVTTWGWPHNIKCTKHFTVDINFTFCHPRSWPAHSTWMYAWRKPLSLDFWHWTVNWQFVRSKGRQASISQRSIGSHLDTCWKTFLPVDINLTVVFCLKSSRPLLLASTSPLCHSLRLTAAVKSPLAMHWHWLCTALYCTASEWISKTMHCHYSTQRLPPNEAQSMLDWIREFLKYCGT